MYLNIINNIKHESKRKSKKIDDAVEKKKEDLENDSRQITDESDSFFYHSVFYGNLTRNWINLKHLII